MSQLVAYCTDKNDCCYNENASYSTCRTASTAGGRMIIDREYDYLIVGQAEYGGQTLYQILRCFLFFDTSSIPINSIITSATLSIYGKDDYSDTDFDIVIQNGQPTYPSDTVELSDYNYLYYQGSSSGGSLSTSGFNTGGYNDITLNLNGLLWIVKNGTTKLCLRSSKDISNTAPTADKTDHIHFWASQKGGAYIPKLTVDYIPAPVVSPTFSIQF